jgi:hypothetical protein
VGGTIALIMASMFFSENYLQSPGFEQRKETFGCLVDYLEEHHIKDEYFNEAKSYEISTKNCSDVVSRTRQSFQIDLSERLNFCEDHINESSQNITTKVRKLDLTKKQEDQLEECQNCVFEILNDRKYENLRLHAAAVNVTIVNLKVWKYFTISSAVKELINQSNSIENRYLSECIKEKLCKKRINFCS